MTAAAVRVDRSIRLDSREAVDRVLMRRVYLRVFPPQLTLETPGLDDGEQRELQSRLDRLGDACGCDSGTAMALLALGAYIVYLVAREAPITLGGTILGSVLVMFLGATAGKLAGIGRARIEMRRVLIGLRETFG